MPGVRHPYAARAWGPAARGAGAVGAEDRRAARGQYGHGPNAPRAHLPKARGLRQGRRCGKSHAAGPDRV